MFVVNSEEEQASKHLKEYLESENGIAICKAMLREGSTTQKQAL